MPAIRSETTPDAAPAQTVSSLSAPVGNWTRHVEVVDGIDAVSWTSGTGPALILIHGIGPGTCGIANFEPLLPTLTARFTVHLVDLIGFGASGRKRSLPYFDMPLWVAQIEAVQARIAAPVALLGNSVGGAIACKVAARDAERCAGSSDSARVAAVASIGSPLQGGVPSVALRRFWQAPADADALAQAMAPMSAAGLPPPYQRVAARFAIFGEQPDYAAYFAAMVASPEDALRAVSVRAHEISALRAPMLIVHGLRDAACLYQENVLPFIAHRDDVDVVLFGECGHNVTWERTRDLLAVVERFLLQHQTEFKHV